MLRHLLLSLLTMAVPGLVVGVFATSASGRYCPWCSFDMPIDNNKLNCKLFVQPPENFTHIIDYPVLLFNHDLTQLVKADFISSYVPVIDWYLNPSPGIRAAGLTMVIMPVSPTKLQLEGDRIAPLIALNIPEMDFKAKWTTIPKAGELAPGVQSTLFVTTVPCGRAL